MGLRDYNNRLTPTAQNFAATAVTTNSQPLPATGGDIGVGEPMALVFTVTVAALKVGTEAYTFQAVTATAADGTTGQVIIAQSAVFTASSGSFAAGTLAVGDIVVVPIPPRSIPATATHLAGRVVIASSGDVTVLCDLVPMQEIGVNKYYTAQPSLQ